MVLRKIALAFFVGLLSLSAFAFCVSFSVQSVGLSEAVWLDAVEKSGAVDQLIAHSDLGARASPELVKRILTREWISGQARTLVHNLLSYAKNERADIELVVDLREPKEKLEALGLGQVQEFQDLPDRVDLLEQTGARESVGQFRQYVQLLQAAVMASFLGALISIAALVFLAGDVKSKVRLPSLGLLLGGLSGLLLALGLGEIARRSLPVEFQATVEVIVAPLLGAVNAWAAAFLVIGVLGLAASHWFVKNGKKAGGT